jgi:hypothetical protein
MNFCKDCKYCREYSFEYGSAYYCHRPTQEYNYITGEKIITCVTCSSVRKDNSICEFFEQKPNKWFKKIIKKLKL